MHNCLSKTTRQHLLVHAEEIDLRGERAKEDDAFVDNSTIFLEDEAFVDDAAAFDDAFVDDVATPDKRLTFSGPHTRQSSGTG